ncbi:hypothetical protein CUMW_039420 [Citrus unshiu]|nr:hypothetical protein CUMW_039420 [Citrus unshiu]
MGDLEKMKNEALEIIGQFENLPRLVCCYEDEIPYLYPHAKGILEALKEKGIHVAVASRSPTPDIAKTFLHKLGIHSMFVPMVSIMGVTSILVDNGINLDALRQGFSEFSQKSGSLSTSRSD